MVLSSSVDAVSTVATGPSQPSALLIRGSLGPQSGSWRAEVPGQSEPMTLQPGNDDNQVAQWVVPVRNIELPGARVVEFPCTAPARKGPRQRIAPDAELALDAWTFR